MDSKSQKTLRQIEQNDAQFRYLRIGYSTYDREFISIDSSDYPRLGAAIGNNTHLSSLVVNPVGAPTLDIANTEFFDGLKQNTSIRDLSLFVICKISLGEWNMKY